MTRIQYMIVRPKYSFTLDDLMDNATWVENRLREEGRRIVFRQVIDFRGLAVVLGYEYEEKPEPVSEMPFNGEPSFKEANL